MKVIANYPVASCGPAGLALGPRREAIVGCGGSFGMPPTTQIVIINLDNGDILANITQAGGNYEVWYDPGTHHYYLAAGGTLDSSGKVTPILGTVDANTFMFDGTNSTSTTAHSVAYTHPILRERTSLWRSFVRVVYIHHAIAPWAHKGLRRLRLPVRSITTLSVAE
jgi:hypothetical protein